MSGGRINGLDLFSGIGGIGIALSEWVRPIAYCDIEGYSQAVLLSGMQRGKLEPAPIWDDVRTLRREHFDVPIDIIYGGFPCQDLSLAGARRGLEGERSGLYFQVERLVRELTPSFVFLENVPGIRTKGAERVSKGLASLGYDCRWTMLSAAQVGANHKRERWFLLAYRKGLLERKQADQTHSVSTSRETRLESRSSGQSLLSDTDGMREPQPQGRVLDFWRRPSDGSKAVPNASGEGLQGHSSSGGVCRAYSATFDSRWWASEPDVGRVANGVQFRAYRLRALGNAVVPAQARQAFKILMGLTA